MAGPQAGDAAGGRTLRFLARFLRSGCFCGGCGGRLCLLYRSARIHHNHSTSPSDRSTLIFDPSMDNRTFLSFCCKRVQVMEGERFIISDKWEGTESVVEG